MNQLRYDTVIWDFDGTLVDTSRGIFSSVVKAYQKLGLMPPEEEILRKFVGPPLIYAMKTFTGLDEQTAVKAVWAFREDYEKEGLYCSNVYDGLVPLIEKLRAHGAKIGVATLKPEFMAKRLLEHFGIAHLIDVCVGSDGDERGGVTKAQMVQAVMEQMGCADKRRAVLIGDTDFDAEGARDAGVDFLGVTYGFGDEAESARAPDSRFFAKDAADIEKILFPGS